ncbi:hypothetical protein K1719_029729 [Acacia pycnantha]|nr:hypothetical protein K1719_029729 [Acacia pycnantha]
MASSSASVFPFLFFLILLLVFSSGYGHRIHENCPSSFQCGELGTFHFPFTKPELQHCGFITVHGCDDHPSSNKSIELDKNNGTKLWLLTGVNNKNTITVLDEDLGKLLKSKSSCHLFDTNLSSSLPPNSALVSFQILNNNTWIKCGHCHNVSRPTGFSKYVCSDYDVYWEGSSRLKHNNNNIQKPTGSFPNCSVLELPSTDMSHRTHDPLSFLTSQIVIQVRLSHECNNCYYHLGGQCLLDANNEFYCKSEDTSKGYMLGFGLGTGGLFIVLIVIVIIYQLRQRHYKKKIASSNVKIHPTNNNIRNPFSNANTESFRAYLGLPHFSYEELEKATDNFDRSRELGTGGFGTVYYGILQDGREVAVKHLYEHNYRRVEQFRNEVKILNRLRHRNLVSLYGCTSCHSRGLVLVYEYIPNGTVYCHLHGELAKRGLLPWPIRIKIAIETATALSYLHASDIIHRDVKTNNILLENNFCVKVADFGLSRLFPDDVTHVSTAPQGTPGYVDPEYYQCYQLTSKSDVYSFGVVLIELISSLLPVDITRNKDEINLANLALKKIQESAFGELVDPCLGFETDSEVRRMIISVAELAFQCLQRDKDLRPSMDEILKFLKRIESGNEEIEEVDVHDAIGIPQNEAAHSPSPSLPDCDELGLLRHTKSLPSSKLVTHNNESAVVHVSA